VARFLLGVWPFTGHLLPNIALAGALRARGHAVALYTGARARPLLADPTLDLFPFQQVPEEQVVAWVTEMDRLSLDWRGWPALRRLLRAWLLETVPAQVADLTAVIAAWSPDVLVCDPALWGPILILSETGRPPVAVVSYLPACLLPGREGPLLGLAWPRPTTWLGWRLRALARGLLELLAADIRRGASLLRRRYGWPPLTQSVTAFAGRLPLYLVASVPEFDYQRADLPPTVRYVGPCLWEGPRGEVPPAWLTDLPADRPLIYVTEGTVHAKAPIVLRAALAGLAGRPVQGVVTTGPQRSPSVLAGAVPPNVRIEQWVPQRWLLERAALVVTTGGSGSVLGALRAGVPLVVVPTAWDQPENAWRVVWSGAGVRLSPRQCTPDRLWRAVERVLGDPAFQANARRLAQAMARYDGPATAAALLETLAARGTVQQEEG